jgi:predicted HTH domain antitoxin
MISKRIDMKVAFELDLPEGTIDTSTQAEFVRSVKEQAVLRLYGQERISSGEAAELLGLAKAEFLELLKISGVGFHAPLDEDDFLQIRRWREGASLKPDA